MRSYFAERLVLIDLQQERSYILSRELSFYSILHLLSTHVSLPNFYFRSPEY